MGWSAAIVRSVVLLAAAFAMSGCASVIGRSPEDRCASVAMASANVGHVFGKRVAS